MMVEAARGRLACTVCSWTQEAAADSPETAEELAAAGV